MEERIRRVISKRREANDGRLDLRKTDEDLGFRVFRLAQSNIKEWDADIAHDVAVLDSQLSLSVDHLRPGRTDSDILYEVILKSGYSLSVKVNVEKIGGKSVYSVSDGAFLICLERDLTLDLIRSISERQPERVLLLDEGFAGKDQLKTNAVQTFKARDIVFRTL
jgi:adenine-specific DNA-methyltransferase